MTLSQYISQYNKHYKEYDNSLNSLKKLWESVQNPSGQVWTIEKRKSFKTCVINNSDIEIEHEYEEAIFKKEKNLKVISRLKKFYFSIIETIEISTQTHILKRKVDRLLREKTQDSEGLRDALESVFKHKPIRIEWAHQLVEAIRYHYTPDLALFSFELITKCEIEHEWPKVLFQKSQINDYGFFIEMLGVLVSSNLSDDSINEYLFSLFPTSKYLNGTPEMITSIIRTLSPILSPYKPRTSLLCSVYILEILSKASETLIIEITKKFYLIESLWSLLVEIPFSKVSEDAGWNFLFILTGAEYLWPEFTHFDQICWNRVFIKKHHEKFQLFLNTSKSPLIITSLVKLAQQQSPQIAASILGELLNFPHAVNDILNIHPDLISILIKEVDRDFELRNILSSAPVSKWKPFPKDMNRILSWLKDNRINLALSILSSLQWNEVSYEQHINTLISLLQISNSVTSTRTWKIALSLNFFKNGERISNELELLSDKRLEFLNNIVNWKKPSPFISFCLLISSDVLNNSKLINIKENMIKSLIKNNHLFALSRLIYCAFPIELKKNQVISIIPKMLKIKNPIVFHPIEPQFVIPILAISTISTRNESLDSWLDLMIENSWFKNTSMLHIVDAICKVSISISQREKIQNFIKKSVNYNLILLKLSTRRYIKSVPWLSLELLTIKSFQLKNLFIEIGLKLIKNPSLSIKQIKKIGDISSIIIPICQLISSISIKSIILPFVWELFLSKFSLFELIRVEEGGELEVESEVKKESEEVEEGKVKVEVESEEVEGKVKVEVESEPFQYGKKLFEIIVPGITKRVKKLCKKIIKRYSEQINLYSQKQVHSPYTKTQIKIQGFTEILELFTNKVKPFLEEKTNEIPKFQVDNIFLIASCNKQSRPFTSFERVMNKLSNKRLRRKESLEMMEIGRVRRNVFTDINSRNFKIGIKKNKQTNKENLSISNARAATDLLLRPISGENGEIELLIRHNLVILQKASITFFNQYKRLKILINEVNGLLPELFENIPVRERVEKEINHENHSFIFQVSRFHRIPDISQALSERWVELVSLSESLISPPSERTSTALLNLSTFKPGRFISRYLSLVDEKKKILKYPPIKWLLKTVIMSYPEKEDLYQKHEWLYNIIMD